MRRSVLVNCVIALLITHSAAHAQIDTGQRVAAPPAAEIESSRAKVREAYSDGYGKPDITANLLAIVAKTRGPADRYALCAEALDLAIRFRNPRGAFASIDRMASMFQIDRISMELPLLTRLCAKVKGKKDAGQLAELACLLLGRCVVANRSADAVRASSLAKSLASLSGDAGIQELVVARSRQALSSSASHHRVAGLLALAAGGEAPDAEAATAIARYLCFLKGDWQRGLSWMAKSELASLRDLAALEDRHPKDLAVWMKLADAWWQVAEAETGVPKFVAMQRASCWSTLVELKSGGFDRIVATELIEQARQEKDRLIADSHRIRVFGWPLLAAYDLQTISDRVEQPLEFVIGVVRFSRERHLPDRAVANAPDELIRFRSGRDPWKQVAWHAMGYMAKGNLLEARRAFTGPVQFMVQSTKTPPPVWSGVESSKIEKGPNVSKGSTRLAYYGVMRRRQKPVGIERGEATRERWVLHLLQEKGLWRVFAIEIDGRTHDFDREARLRFGR